MWYFLFLLYLLSIPSLPHLRQVKVIELFSLLGGENLFPPSNNVLPILIFVSLECFLLLAHFLEQNDLTLLFLISLSVAIILNNSPHPGQSLSSSILSTFKTPLSLSLFFLFLSSQSYFFLLFL